jgi:hypothetical protein
MPRPDDEKATDPILYVIVGLASLVLILLGLLLLFFPPVFAAGLVVRASRGGSATLKWIGIALFVAWFIGFYFVGRRVMAPRRPSDEESSV